jgi:hypothetical protein
MSLADYKVPKADIAGLTVRGLTFPDIVSLAKSHGDDLAAVLGRLDNKAVNMEKEAVKALLSDTLPRMPGLGAAIIATACDEPEQFQTALKLPLGIQIEAIAKIGELTFAVEGGAKQVFQTVMRVLGGTTALMT